jgi:hypothetical protein
VSASIRDLICPHIDKKKAKSMSALYYFDYDGMPFDSMRAHCRYCPEYDNIYRKAREVLGRRVNG